MPQNRAALYVRVAFHSDATTTGLDQQLSQVREYALQRKFEITQIYQDMGSGLKEDRSGLQQLLIDARAGLFDVVAMRDPARLFRHWALFQHYYTLLCEDLGIEVIFTIQNDGNECDTK